MWPNQVSMDPESPQSTALLSWIESITCKTVIVVRQGPNPGGHAGGDLCKGELGSGTDPLCLTASPSSSSPRKPASAPLLLPWKPSHLHHGDSQLAGSSLSGRRYLQGEGGKCPQTLLCCLRGSLRSSQPGLEMPLCSGMQRHSRRCPQSSVSRPGCPGEAEAGRMVFCGYF